MKYVLVLDYLFDGNDVTGERDASGVYEIDGDLLTMDELFENGSFVAFSESRGAIIKAAHRMKRTKPPF